METFKIIYDMIPKWVLLFLVVVLIFLVGWLWAECQYFKIDNAKLTASNKILTDNAEILKSKLATCGKSLMAEAENARVAEAINAKMRKYKTDISKICVKEPTDEKEKAGIRDAIAISNRLSDTVNQLHADKGDSK